jgi:hypothetical protein
MPALAGYAGSMAVATPSLAVFTKILGSVAPGLLGEPAVG